MNTRMSSRFRNSTEENNSDKLGGQGSQNKPMDIGFNFRNPKVPKMKSAVTLPSGRANGWKCDRCDITLTKGTYYYHMDKHKVSDGTSKYKCFKCNEQFVSNWYLKRHLELHNNALGVTYEERALLPSTSQQNRYAGKGTATTPKETPLLSAPYETSHDTWDKSTLLCDEILLSSEEEDSLTENVIDCGETVASAELRVNEMPHSANESPEPRML